MQAWIFRFVSLLGERYTHGHVVDFVRQLREHPEYLNVLGDGSQRKSYLYIGDCIDAMLLAVERCTQKVTVLNLGAQEYCSVNDSIGWICAELGVQPERRYSGGDRGWVGDNPFIFLDTTAIRELGWKPTLSIEAGVRRTVGYLSAS
jgi:UDP-glucose 4-epimerase